MNSRLCCIPLETNRTSPIDKVIQVADVLGGHPPIVQLPHQRKFPSFAGLGIALGGLGFEVGEDDPGEGIVGLLEDGFVGLVVQKLDRCKLEGQFAQGGGDFAGGGSPGAITVAENGQTGGEDAIAIEYPGAVSQHPKRESRFLLALNFDMDQQPFRFAIQSPNLH